MNHSLLRRKLYSILVVTVSIALICSPIPPQGWGSLFGVGVVHAAPAATGPVLAAPGVVNSPMTRILQESLPSGLAKQLTDMGALSPDGEPAGMLINVDALRADTPHESSSYADPVSISRVQSAYQAADAISGMLMITFTVTNNQPPSITPPQLPVSATMTDTIAAMSAIDFSRDPNVIHNVLIADSLTSDATFIDSVPMPDRAAPQYAWNLGDIPPLSSVTATLTVRVPTTVTDFIDLDTGATAWGTLQGRMVSAQARPASLVPDTINGEPVGDWLKWTVDADKYDAYMLVKAAELQQDPIRMFEYVRSLGYESYKGSLRGTRGTLWGEAGNSLDQASLLIAMLRASGVPSRYRHGTLDETPAQELICSMFPEPTNLVGHIKWTHETSGG